MEASAEMKNEELPTKKENISDQVDGIVAATLLSEKKR